MPRIQDTDEVRILRFFEEGPIEKAELLYNIVAQKMRLRLKSLPGREPRSDKARNGSDRKVAPTA